MKFISAENVALRTFRAFDTKIQVLPKKIINDLEKFNNIHKTNFSNSTNVEELVFYIRKKYNTLALNDFSVDKSKAKEQFNELFDGYALIVY